MAQKLDIQEGDYVLISFKANNNRPSPRRAFGIVIEVIEPYKQDTPLNLQAEIDETDKNYKFRYFSVMETYWKEHYNIQINKDQQFISIIPVHSGADMTFTYPMQFIVHVFKDKFGRNLIKKWENAEFQQGDPIFFDKYCFPPDELKKIKKWHKEEKKDIKAAMKSNDGYF
jgi:hypothetical protein